MRSGWQFVGFFAQRPHGQTLSKNKKADRGNCPLVTYAVARSFQESE
ncbi:hypothetical protein EDC52_104280 [Biostraticola tofi]|uniref:Uncharacterized protein n=1 Tax=Biostraticola tofi TaxID=466109 RepID=A0A4R3YW73_9GAMM|nr:hypothetical protein EDC52_104280 [Biostraticola tofi]